MALREKNVRTTYVFIHRAGDFVPAGRLQFFDKGDSFRADLNDSSRFSSTFEYGHLYVRRPDAVSVDPASLPLPLGGRNPRPVSTSAGFDLFNGLRDSAPDGWGRFLMDRAASPKVLNELDYLLASGDDRVGALAFGPEPTKQPTRSVHWDEAKEASGDRAGLEALLRATEEILSADDFPESARVLLNRGLSTGGARPKVTLAYEAERWLAKFSLRTDSYPVVRAERAAMALAPLCGVTAPRTKLASVSGTPIYLIERFDRREENGRVIRIPFASALTMLGAHEMAAHRYSYVDLAEVLRKYGSSPTEDLRQLFRRVVLNVLTGNDDDHLRNHGFLHDGKGWRLSPSYDVTPKPQASLDRRLCLALGDRGKEATLANAVTFHGHYGLTYEDASVIAEEMRVVVAARWKDECHAAGMSASDISRMANCFAESEKADWNSEIAWKP